MLLLLLLYLVSLIGTSHHHLVMAAVTQPAGGGGPAVALNLAFMFPTDITDLGFTYQFNIARLNAMRRLSDQYASNFSFSSRTIVSVNNMSLTTLTQTISNISTGPQACDIVFGFSSGIFSRIPNFTTWISTSFPSTRYIDLNLGALLSGKNGGNYATMGIQMQAAAFQLGAAAGAACLEGSTVAILMPLNFSSAVNAFYRGMLFGQTFRDQYNASRYGGNAEAASIFSGVASGNNTFPVDLMPMCKLLVVNQNSFDNEKNELEIAELFLSKRNASVVYFWVDRRAAALYVQRSRTSPDVYSIVYSTDGVLVIGDSVLTSLVVRADEVIYQAVVDLINSVPANQTNYLIRVQRTSVSSTTSVGFRSNWTHTGSTVGMIAATAPKEVPLAIHAAQQYATTYPVLCGPLVDAATGVTRTPAGICLTQAQMQFQMNYLLGRGGGIQQLPDYISSNVCPAGTWASRNISTFLPTCVPCAVNTISAAAGSRSCTPCLVGQSSNENRTACIVNTLPTSVWLMVAIAVGCSLGGASVLVLAAVYLVKAYKYRSFSWFLRIRSTGGALTHHLTPAPRGPRVAIAMVAIDELRSDPTWRRSIAFVANVYALLDGIVSRVCAEHLVYVTINVGDLFVLVHDRPDVLFRALSEIDEQFRAAARRHPLSKSKFALRMLLHYCEAVVISSSRGGGDGGGDGDGGDGGGDGDGAGGDAKATQNQHNTGGVPSSSSKSERWQYLGTGVGIMKMIWSSPEVHKFSPYCATNDAAQHLVPISEYVGGHKNSDGLGSNELPGLIFAYPVAAGGAGGIGLLRQEHDVIVRRMVDYDPRKLQEQQESQQQQRRQQQAAVTDVHPQQQKMMSQFTVDTQRTADPRTIITQSGSLMESTAATTTGSSDSDTSSIRSNNVARGEAAAVALAGRVVVHNSKSLAAPSSFVSSSMLSTDELALMVRLTIGFVGRFLNAMEPNKSLDALLYAVVRLHIAATLSDNIKVPSPVVMSRVSTFVGFSSTVSPRVLASPSAHQQRNDHDAAASLSPFNNTTTELSPLDLTKQQTTDTTTTTTTTTDSHFTQRLAKNALKGICWQVILSMDEVELVRWMRDALELRMAVAVAGKEE